MRSPLLDEAAAVPADGPDTGVAAHYGDPFAEQRALAAGAGVVDCSHRGVIRVTGPDRLSWLHSLTTQHLAALAPGASAQALILSPSGHIEEHLTLADDGTATWAHVEPGTAGPLLEFLTSMRFMLAVEPADVTAEFGVLRLAGPQAAAVKEAAGGLGAGASAAVTGPLGIDLIVARDQLAAVAARLQAAGAVRAGSLAAEATRIAAGEPRLGLDTDHRTIPHEVGWIPAAVHLDKGCYRGQETVARVHNLGHPPRRLVRLLLDGSENRLPGHGEPVLQGDRPVGFVGSAAQHYELGPVALALVKRTVPVAETLTVAGLAAAQEVIVPPDAGANVTVTLRRRGDLAGRGRE